MMILMATSRPKSIEMRGRLRRNRPRDAPIASERGAILQHLKGRAAAFIDSDDLAIDEDNIRSDAAHGFHNCWKVAREIFVLERK